MAAAEPIHFDMSLIGPFAGLFFFLRDAIDCRS